MTTFGSTKQEEENDRPLTPREIEVFNDSMRRAALNRQEKATVGGLSIELQVLKQQLENVHGQMRELIALYGTLQGEFNTFRAQRNIELQALNSLSQKRTLADTFACKRCRSVFSDPKAFEEHVGACNG